MVVKTGVAQVGQKKSRRGTEKNGERSDINGGGESEHGMHIWTERERRKKMRKMFSSLHALLPNLPPKADKSSVVDEAVKYIKNLQETIQAQEKQRPEKFRGATSVDYEPSVVRSQSQARALESREAFLAAQGPPAKSFAMTPSMLCPQSVPPPPACFQTCFSPNVVLNMCGGDAQFSVCSPGKTGLLTAIFCIIERHNLEVLSAHVSSDQHCSIYMIHARAARAFEEYPEALSVEDTFKLAAGEMNLWLLSC